MGFGATGGSGGRTGTGGRAGAGGRTAGGGLYGADRAGGSGRWLCWGGGAGGPTGGWLCRAGALGVGGGDPGSAWDFLIRSSSYKRFSTPSSFRLVKTVDCFGA